MTAWLVAWCLGAGWLAVRLARCLWQAPRIEPPAADESAAPAWPAPVDAAQLEVGWLLARLVERQPRLAKVVVLCRIGGLDAEHAAGVLGVSSALVERDLAVASELLAGAEPKAAASGPSTAPGA
ncbi:MAG: hypothetical protein KF830_00915 [Planctomycetes bacterium]|nr:hypothetical protein [Planctomycetota bacterium]